MVRFLEVEHRPHPLVAQVRHHLEVERAGITGKADGEPTEEGSDVGLMLVLEDFLILCEIGPTNGAPGSRLWMHRRKSEFPHDLGACRQWAARYLRALPDANAQHSRDSKLPPTPASAYRAFLVCCRRVHVFRCVRRRAYSSSSISSTLTDRSQVRAGWHSDVVCPDCHSKHSIRDESACCDSRGNVKRPCYFDTTNLPIARRPKTLSCGANAMNFTSPTSRRAPVLAPGG